MAADREPERLSADRLAEFLIAARKEGYAGGGPRQMTGSTRRYEHLEGDLHYIDEYTGNVRDAGWERVLLGGLPLWSMVYFGGMVQPDVDRRPVFAFLRRCLRHAPDELPLRGPERLRSDAMEYSFRAIGDLGRFHGQEVIRWDDVIVYRREVFGGALLDTALTSPFDREMIWGPWGEA